MSFYAIRWALAQEIKPTKEKSLRANLKLALIALANYAKQEPPFECWPSCKKLSLDTHMDLKTIKKCLADLQSLGFITDSGKRTGKTRSVKVHYLIISKEYQTKVKSISEPNGGIACISEPNGGIASKQAVPPLGSLSGTVVPTEPITLKEPINNTQNLLEEPQPAGITPPALATQDSLCVFDEFFSIFPKKVAREAALAAWEALTQAEHQAALEGARRYLAHFSNRTKEPGFNPDKTPQAATWIANKRWTDVYTTEETAPAPARTQNTATKKIVATRERLQLKISDLTQQHVLRDSRQSKHLYDEMQEKRLESEIEELKREYKLLVGANEAI